MLLPLGTLRTLDDTLLLRYKEKKKKKIRKNYKNYEIRYVKNT